MFGRPDVVRRGFCKEVSPVGGFCPLDNFEIARLGQSCNGVAVGGSDTLGLAGGLCELLPEGGEEWGPPCFGSCGEALVECGGFECRCKYRECGGEPLVELVGRGSVGRGTHQPPFELVSKGWPVCILPAWFMYVVMGARGPYGNQKGGMV